MKSWRTPLQNPFGGNQLIEYYLRGTIRNKVLYDWTKYTKKGQESEGIDWKVFCQALDRLSMYSLVNGGNFSYFDLGVASIYGGGLPSHIIKEHQQISLFYQEAYQEKKRMS